MAQDTVFPDLPGNGMGPGDDGFAPEIVPAFEVSRPQHQRLPLVFASPHSGSVYPESLKAASRLTDHALRKSEDCFVDEIFAAAPDLGAPLIRALFPRVYVDPNREPFELDPAMFEGRLPDYANTRSPRVAAGLGTIARIVADGEPIYRGKLPVAEAMRRIATCYRPYHAALGQLVEETRQRFGFAILVDCHSMPSTGLSPIGSGPYERKGGGQKKGRIDAVLGDCFGTSCSQAVTERCEALLSGLGYSVVRNHPYAGGYTTRHYGRPREGVHAIQIEIRRALYMDERQLLRKPHMAVLAGQMRGLIDGLGEINLNLLAAE
jgi:N-formylglutamate amidohydrolase